MGYYRIQCPEGVLLDVSSLRGLSVDKLRAVSEAHRLFVPWQVMREIMTHEDQAIAVGLLKKLQGLKAVLTCPMQRHFRYELTEGVPSGILAMHNRVPAFPEESFQVSVGDALSLLTSLEPDRHQLLAEYRDEFDKGNEDAWLKCAAGFLAKANALAGMNSLRKQLRNRFFSGPDLARAELRRILRPQILAKIETLRGSLDLAIAVEFPVRDVNESWVLYRWVFGLTWYNIKNTVANPDRFRHERLNQRMDLLYIALLHPGLKLLSADGEMRELATCLHGAEGIYDGPDLGGC